MDKYTDEQIQEKLENGWQYDGDVLWKEYDFKDDSEANDFVNKVAELANEMNHHPEINWQFNKVKVSVYTHYVDAITNLDFELVKKIDK